MSIKRSLSLLSKGVGVFPRFSPKIQNSCTVCATQCSLWESSRREWRLYFSEKLQADELVTSLTEIFFEFNVLVTKYELEKIKTIVDT